MCALVSAFECVHVHVIHNMHECGVVCKFKHIKKAIKILPLIIFIDYANYFIDYLFHLFTYQYSY